MNHVARINADFSDALTSACRKRGLKRDGFPPINSSYETDGSVTVIFGGFNERKQYVEKSVSFRALLPATASSDEIAAAANPEVLADACGEAIADIELKQKLAGYVSPLGNMARA